ncbi:hypothetical protein QBC35DRAFT_498378 [Podospora australis]|uniref:Actin-related protein 10 n=1 Tax=Podospora australis TaxID=1536484 RepID=A0AAN6WTC3_9PEZI|nr:hypothetical protein QBC35DRAFT_498378 [Podospora australis]
MASSSTPGGGGAVPQHRSVASIRSPHHHTSGSSNPSTPHRPIHSNFGSPSSLRADEDIIIIELGTRKLQVGFAGDAAPRGCVWFGPEQLRRVGDFRDWSPEYKFDWRKTKDSWGRDHELWDYDVRGNDLGLIGDKIERALRDAYTKYMLIDSRPRRMVCVLPSGLPIPVLSAALDSLFSRFQPPTISLLSSSIALTVGAGVRSSLIIDLGWRETVVTGVYEYREMNCNRSIRGGKLLAERTHNLLAKHLSNAEKKEENGEKIDYQLSFEECNDIATRLVWCKSNQQSTKTAETSSEGLPTLHEQDESEPPTPAADEKTSTVSIPLRSYKKPVTLELPWDALAEPAEDAFFDSQYSAQSFDDHELPLHLLVYRSLLQLPLDARALCMSRIIFTGGCSSVLGLRSRIVDEVMKLVQVIGWDGVVGKGVEQTRANPKIKPKGVRPVASTTASTATRSPSSAGPGVDEELDGVWHDAANALMEVDPIEEQLKRGRDNRPVFQGKMRAIESVGAWSGASLVAQLKASPVSTIDREIWLQHGAAGASKAGEVDQKSSRQSLGAGGLIRGSASGASWTLGVWGAN